MKKLFVLPVLLLFFVTVSFSQNQFILKGKLKGISSGKAELTYKTFENSKWSENKLETSIVKGIFMFKNKLEEPVKATLKINEVETVLFIEPTVMNFYLNKSQPERYKLNGSRTHNECVKLNSEIENDEIFLKELNDTLGVIYKNIEKLEEGSPNQIKLYGDANTLSLIQKNINTSKRDKIHFIVSNPNSYSSILNDYLFYLTYSNEITTDSAQIIFNKLDNKVKKHSCGVQLDTYLKSIENTQVGKIAPNFSTKDVNGKLVTLSDYKGQYVFLDFWASWCTWCVKGLPHSNEFYERYHDKGLQVIGITSDRLKEEWIKSIEKNQINDWINVMCVSDIEKAQQGYVDYEDIERKYCISPLPVYILIDKEGKIINKWDGYSEENEKEMDEVMKSIFGF